MDVSAAGASKIVERYGSTFRASTPDAIVHDASEPSQPFWLKEKGV